ncbi:hypothetical protein DW352_13435 [Pseudolabrys taiwanensis]|uniref:Uncharacterized protein n=1 Tax=Pseudolabrys taiwanensis TaxID=331696 RepID=A0A345ZWX7_9HYPH|nr:hypothetical protein DW352_13435 [Pseudolabrys taiwanensis]
MKEARGVISAKVHKLHFSKCIDRGRRPRVQIASMTFVLFFNEDDAIGFRIVDEAIVMHEMPAKKS